MSALEFAEWQVMFRNEQLHPAVDQFRHAQVLAALHTGPAQRKDKKPWSTDSFIAPNPWRSLVRAAAGKVVSEADRMKSLFRGRRGQGGS